MNEQEIAKVHDQVALVAALAASLPSAVNDDGLALFEAARTLVDEACGIMTTLCEVWSARKPLKPAPSPTRRITTDDLII